MIENLRKYTGLIIFFMALVVLALVIGIKDDLFRGSGGGQAILKIDGRTYSDTEFRRLGSGAIDIASGLARAGDFGFYQFIMSLTSGAENQEAATERFFTSRILIRQAKNEFGVHPGEEEVSEYLRKLRSFSTPDGKFDQEKYQAFVEKGLGRLGMTEADLRELAADAIATEKINQIIGSGLAASREVTAHNLALDNQKITGELANLSIDSYETAINPSEEEIKAYWENIQDAFTTEPQRKFTYVIITPKMPADTAAEADKAPESIADAAASDEAKKEAEKKKAAEKAEKAAKLAEERRKIQMETDQMVEDFSIKLEEQKGEGFEKLAADNGWEVKTSDLFSVTKPPKELDVMLRASSRKDKAADELFRMVTTSDPISKISQPIAIGENQWLIARLDGEEKSRTKTYEEAKAEARDQYINEKATEAMKKAAEEAVAKIKEALAAGKPFAEAAKAAGIEKTQAFSNVSTDYRPGTANEPANLFQATRNVDPGGLAEIITEADRTFIVHVAKREVVRDANPETRIAAEITRATSANEMIAFMGWLATRIEAAKVEQLYK